MKNLPVVEIEDISRIPQRLIGGEEKGILSLKGIASPTYEQITALAQAICHQMAPPVFLCLRQDMGKALGQALALEFPREATILCIDGLRVGEGSYLDIGAPVGGAMPVVIKTLVLSK
jgi:ethanolamine utilization protein EutA